jgi:hypothetical protein
MFSLQNWHINGLNDLVLQPGTGQQDCARGYYDPDHNEVVITLEALNRRTRRIDRAVHRLVMGRLRNRWPTSYIRSETE